MAKPLAAITGASSGIGEVYARRLAATHDLLLIARNEERLNALAAELSARHNVRATVLPADLSRAEDVAMVAEALAQADTLELLVNNAGFGTRGLFWTDDPKHLQKMHELHIVALMRLSHAALKGMVARDRGAIINLASVAAFARRAGSAAYAGTKAWVAAFSEGLYVDLNKAGSRVTVQALCPGYTYSAFHDVLKEDRSRLAPSYMWLSPELVVDESLAALNSGKLYVVPGWRYRVVVRLLRWLPLSLGVRLARFGAR